MICEKQFLLLFFLAASNPVDGSNCKSTISSKPSCTDNKATVLDASKFNFAFWTCSTPVVNTVSVNNGTTDTDVVITGEGFSETECQNEVTFGGFKCIVSSSTDQALTCSLESQGEPELGILHQLEMRVQNLGKARINIPDAKDRGFAVIPNIKNITPTSGSLAGGARMTIAGFGFGESPLVSVGGYSCQIVTSSYSEIVCETPSSASQGQKQVEVFAYVNGVPLQAQCETLLQTCLYSYASIWTPTVHTIVPVEMSSQTSFEITGTSLGNNISELVVTASHISGTVELASNDRIQVSFDNLPAGDNEVIVRVKDYGKATGSLSVFSTLTVSSVFPRSGSIHGETVITVSGNGFVENDTTVSLGGDSCDVLFTNLSTVTCITQAHAAGSVGVDITSSGESESSSTYSFATNSTPTIASINPTFGLAGDTLTISGTNLNGGSVTVLLGESGCDFISGNDAQIICTVGDHSTGEVPVFVDVTGAGASNSDVLFEYQLSLSGITPTEGKLFLFQNTFLKLLNIPKSGRTRIKINNYNTSSLYSISVTVCSSMAIGKRPIGFAPFNHSSVNVT